MNYLFTISTNSYSGYSANITYNPATGGTIDLGSVVLPYEYFTQYYYGVYEIYIPETDVTCVLDYPLPSPTPTITPTNTVTPTVTPTKSITPTVTPTNTITPTLTPGLSPSPTPTITPTNTVTPTVTCARPEGLNNYLFGYVCNSVIFTGSLNDACNSLNCSPSLGSYSVQSASLNVGETVYLFTDTSCLTVPTGYYTINNDTVIYVVDGIIDSYPICPT